MNINKKYVKSILTTRLSFDLHKKRDGIPSHYNRMVGTTGFEPAAFSSQN